MKRFRRTFRGSIFQSGYPELYAEALSQNEAMRESVRKAVTGGLPCIAECGGFMYLTEKIGRFPMAGALKGVCFDTGKLTRFGYVTLTAQKDNLLCRAGEADCRARISPLGCRASRREPSARKNRRAAAGHCAHASRTLYAGFPHFHFYANPSFAVRFLDACRKGILPCWNK
ncbi:MAG: hypothetical protein ACLR8U_03800 [Oscillospiraceae bacterium]